MKKVALLLLAFTFIFSCERRLSIIQGNSLPKVFPLSTAENIKTKYTDSGYLKSVLSSSKMMNYSNQPFPFYEFPKGINLTLLNKNKDSSKVFSNTAKIYNDTDIIDLRGNVILITADSDSLFTEQLYYDQKREWLFTDFPVKFRTRNYITNGNGFDANQNFTNAQVLEVSGRIKIRD